MSPQTALAVRTLRTAFINGADPVQAVQSIDFEVAAGQTLVLLGESGSGKSVTIRSILGLAGANARVEGSVTLHGRELIGQDLSQVRGAQIALVPQDPIGALDPLRSIGAQIAEVLRTHLRLSRAAARERTKELLSEVGIAEPTRVARARAHELSGGMCQRVAIAIAIACEPQVLLADEPTTALDVTVQAQILELFTALQALRGTAMVLVTHDVGVADQIGGCIAVMYAGRVVETGRTRDVLDAPRHPYTAGLLASLPGPEIERGHLPFLPGRPPAAGEATSGCAFAPRCPLAEPSCTLQTPALVDAGAQRQAACPVVVRDLH
ncbi:ABC transporter ATP-binding protein [Streptomyces sp. NBC_01643]|uniref:ABC transporter ATP-binding protein n=1 Tax=Streptomyces sp. NBC_01643 TaxID=2975906 RepID=UPI002F90AF71|nr:ABC transporter ATP-binding protein [Streptomyces sp. NBC_01643]